MVRGRGAVSVTKLRADFEEDASFRCVVANAVATARCLLRLNHFVGVHATTAAWVVHRRSETTSAARHIFGTRATKLP